MADEQKAGLAKVQLAALAEVLLFLLTKFPVKAFNFLIFLLIKVEIEERYGVSGSYHSSEIAE